ncbi:acetyl-CoA C-acetyltransferase [Granulicella tundricola]|uniref:Acetyl-CoA acetyltransferase n=1 Tax=Granulicella tundricola (strain ATCC BAA-1859 / DSM 23138 / MP5ACTX9) TaxID=1198114 RepID=E8X2V0_GRATM|nr:acetyl-CoA C-acetyltransferase [Granulicella tundricola]ADW68084.1 acetyl-CoA acetyltransferase [Granulicella tundricola MP5ACTX9]
MRDVVIVSAVRTAVGKFQGALSELSATQLGAYVVREAVLRAGLPPAEVNECIMGCVLPAGLGQNPARQAALGGGLADSVAALTINMVCGSGLKAVALGAQAIMLGDAEIVVAGGMESMSNAPYLLPQARKGYRMGDGKVVDSMVKDGLWCACDDQHMGMTGELVADKHSITREEQDAYAVESHRRAANAWAEGRFAAEVMAIETPGKKGTVTVFDHDESIRPDTSLELLAALKPAFKKDGTITAGNAPGVNDAAAALVLMSAEKAKALGLRVLVKIKAQAQSGVAPRWVMLAPVLGVERVLKKAGWSKDGVDLFELNEAFSVQALGVTRELGLDLNKVNVNGGAVAIGHPIGASGARVLVTLIHEMLRRDVHRGVAALCLGGGNSVALAVER